MKLPASLVRNAWLLAPALALGFLLWVHLGTVRRVDYVTGIGRTAAAVQPTVTPGQAGTRELIVPEHINQSYAWIAQTQMMLARGDWRVRFIDHENVPHGREVHTASPYRWWLSFVGWLQHNFTGRTLFAAIERAALYADPLLHGLLLLAGTGLAAWRFGAFAASLTAGAIALLFPFSAGFQPGTPDDFSLLLVITPCSLLLFMVALRAGAASPAAPHSGQSWGAARPGRWWYVASGALSGAGLWINVPGQIPLLLGIAVGGVFIALVQRPNATGGGPAAGLPVDWRAWALGGAVTVLFAYLLEYFPSHMGGWELRVVHPLYAAAWLGAGELLARCSTFLRRENPSWRTIDWLISLLAIAAVSTVPVLMWRLDNPGFLAVDVLAYRLTKQPDAVMAPNLAVWFSGDDLDATFWITLLPLLAVVVAGWFVVRRTTDAQYRAALAFALGPVLALLVLAYLYLRWWQLLGAVLIPLFAAIAGTTSKGAARWIWGGLAALLIVPGAWQLNLPTGKADENVLTVPETEGLVERDLAQWLAQHSIKDGGVVVLAPPSLSSSLYYYAGIRGLGSMAWENKLGLAVTLRVAISTTNEEALTLMAQRGVTHIILPSWDDFFEPYIQAASVQTNDLFFASLNQWVLPLWLRPVPYQMPRITGFENQTVRIFELVDEQDEPVAACRLTEYFIAQGQLENAKIAAQQLRRYPADFGALVSRAQLDAALVDGEAFTIVFNSLLQRLAGGADRSLLWDQRVNLAIVLARGKRLDLAHKQVQRCLADANARRIKSLPTTALFHLLVLAKAVKVDIADPELRRLATELLSDEMRAHLSKAQGG